MKAKAVVGCAVLAAGVIAPQAQASVGVPLTASDGVVVAWQAKSKTAVVVLTNRRVLVVHSLRRYAPGRWVRVRGVKWGSAIAGVKWGFRPRGVKWGIRLARNGTYSAGLMTLGTVRRTMSLRAVVIRRSSGRWVVSVPGASWSVRWGRRAVWLPGPKLVNAAGGNGFGATVTITVSRASDGVIEIVKAGQVQGPTAGKVVPVAGTVLSRNALTKKLTVLAGGPSGVAVTITVPDGVDMRKYPVGSEISGTVMTGAGALVLTGISRNDSFTAADSSASTVGAVVPPGLDPSGPGNSENTPAGSVAPPIIPTIMPGDPPGQPTPEEQAVIDAQLAELKAIQDSWTAAHAADPKLVVNPGLYLGQGELLDHVRDSIAARKRTLAVLQLVAFELVVGAQKVSAIDPAYKLEIIGKTTALRVKLLTPTS